MSVWEFNAAVAGWTRAHVPPDKDGIGSTEERELIAMLDEGPR